MVSWIIKIGGLALVGTTLSALITTLQFPEFNWGAFFSSIFNFLFFEQPLIGGAILGIVAFLIGMHWGPLGIAGMMLFLAFLFFIMVIVIPLAVTLVLLIITIIFFPSGVALCIALWKQLVEIEFIQWAKFALIMGGFVLFGALFSVPIIGWALGYVVLPIVIVLSILAAIVLFAVLGGATINMYTRTRAKCKDQKTLLCKLMWLGD